LQGLLEDVVVEEQDGIKGLVGGLIYEPLLDSIWTVGLKNKGLHEMRVGLGWFDIRTSGGGGIRQAFD